VLGLLDLAYLKQFGHLPNLKDIWFLAGIVPGLCGAAVTLGAGGATTAKRVIGAALCGGAVGVLYTVLSALIANGGAVEIGEMGSTCLWRIFIFGLFSTLGTLFTEIELPEPTAR